ncbi:MAG: ADP-ribosylglycohydrolase family protein, partial [Lentisphaeria bacterium]|nr:ADP-ribosylglycohydrolase family protein [Lentisphaeria bacterium]
EALGVEMEATLATGSVDALLALQQSWWERPSPPSFPYQEPNDWETISAGFPDDASRAPFSGTEADLFDRLHGGWLGRCAGCQLGKPLEIWNASDPDTIEKTLRASGSYPLEFYMNPIPASAQLDWHPNPTALLSPERRALCRGGFSAVAPDDDIHYVLLSQMVLERYGIGFASSQALRLVADRSPYAWTWASGKNMIRMGNLGLGPPDTALFGNPCRQSLGAQIRCDPWGWAAPGHPSLAARLAYKDAVNSQTRNGIYSGIFFAVLLADVLAHGEIPRAVHTALAHVPPRSRLAEMLRFLINACGRESDWRPVCTAIHERPYHYAKRFNHAIPNAAIVVLGLLKGEGNFARTLGITVMAGLDTDCNGATAGSILGCALGAARIPTAWVEPFHDTVHTQLPGMAALSIESLARRMTALATPTAFTHTRIPG